MDLRPVFRRIDPFFCNFHTGNDNMLGADFHLRKKCLEWADQNTCGALLKFFMKTAMHGTSCVLSAIFVQENCQSFTSILLSEAIAQWVGHWTVEHKVLSCESQESTD